MKIEKCNPEMIYECIENACDSSLVSRLFLDLLSLNRDPPNNLEIQRHPLGFLAFKWPINDLKVLRLHVWDSCFDWAQPEDLQIHDHAFNFKSVILIGSIRNTIYSIKGKSHKYFVLKTSYADGQSILNPTSKKIGLNVDHEETYSAGNYYKMKSNVLHRTKLQSNFGITALATDYSSQIKEGARVISRNESKITFQRDAIGPVDVENLIRVANSYLQKSLINQTE